MNSSTDRIERESLIAAPRARVWQALSNAAELGQWFGVALQGKELAVGQYTRGHITYPGYEHLVFEVLVERIEPERFLSWRWHPYAIDPSVDYSQEPTTLVSFELSDVEDSATRLKLVEAGFDQLPAARRQEAFRVNSNGWDIQMQNIAQHVAAP